MKGCQECGSEDGYHAPSCQTGAEIHELRSEGSLGDALEDYSGPNYVGEEEYPGKPTPEQLAKLGLKRYRHET